MSFNKTLKSALLGILIVVSLSNCKKDDSDTLPSIAAIAVTNPAFSTLEDAAVLGGVVGVLSNSNPNDASMDYTVFAPANSAFSKLGLSKGDDLAVLNKTFLTNTLLYHVSNGNLLSSNIAVGGVTGSALGVNRRFILRGSERYINGSKIVSTDIPAANGTVHVIDKVLLGVNADIPGAAIALTQSQVFRTPELTYLVEALIYCELVGALTQAAGSPNFTVFAPTDAAFIQLGTTLGLSFTKPSDIRTLPKDLVTKVLLNHVVNDGGKFTSESDAGIVSPLSGESLTYGTFNNGIYTIKSGGNSIEANMVIPDIQVLNGVVHLIDRVLLP